MSRKRDPMSSYNVLKSNDDIVNYLYVNVYKQKQKDFYQNLQHQALEKFIAANFEDSKLSHQHAIFIVNLLHKQIFILDIAFNIEQFNFGRVFGFLKKQITMNRLRALEQMFLPYCKKHPQKVLEMLNRNRQIKKDLMNRLYLRNIFKFIYTTLFCLKNIEVKSQAKMTQEMLGNLVDSVFRFSPAQCQPIKEKGLFFLDYVEVVENFRDFLDELIQNMETVYFPILVSFLTLLNQQYAKRILELFETFRKDQKLRQFNQTLIEILLNLMKVFESLKINLNRDFTPQQKKLLENVQRQLTYTSIYLANKISFFTQILLEKHNINMNFSSGETIRAVGMIRYRILELIEKLLSINELVNLQIQFKNFNFIPVIQFYIEQHKWNNITHNLILKITQLIISNDYKNFKKRYLSNDPIFTQNLFGHLISNFRNRKYIFLHSFKMMNNGNRCPIYQLSKMIVNEMKQRNDLNTLMKKFKLWKQFMENDMKQFQSSNYKVYKVPETQNLPVSVKKRNNSFDFSRSSSSTNLQMRQNNKRALETFDQILEQIKNSQKWSALDEPSSPSRRFSTRKNFVKHFDSIGYLEESQL